MTKEFIESFWDALPLQKLTDIHLSSSWGVHVRDAEGRLSPPDRIPWTRLGTRSAPAPDDLLRHLLFHSGRRVFRTHPQPAGMKEDDPSWQEFFRSAANISATLLCGEDLYRLRIARSFSTGGVEIFVRLLPYDIPKLDSLSETGELRRLFPTDADLPYGLFLVNGPTGAGKSTLLASFIDDAVTSHPYHAVTIEEPVEYLYGGSDQALGKVTQHGVPENVTSFEEGLWQALREDPDIILVGEIRSGAEAESALAAAETGHFVAGTIHAGSLAGSLERFLGMLPGNDAPLRVAESYLGGASMSLTRTRSGSRIRKTEFTATGTPIRTIIRERRLAEFENARAEVMRKYK